MTGWFLCHPELAAKSLETMSKRDFMPLPGVSGSYRKTSIAPDWQAPERNQGDSLKL